MFRVDVDSLAAYLDFDPKRKGDLLKLHAAIIKAAPNLKRHFHAGTPEGHAGMRFKMIGYGRYHYTAGAGEKIAWPVIGVALQKNYISVYVSVTRNGKSLVALYADRLGAKRSGGNNFSFESFDDLDAKTLSELFAETGGIFREDPNNPVCYRQGKI